MTITKHKHYALGYRAYSAISFSPEKRAESECKFFDEIIEEFKQLGADERTLNKFENMFIASLRAKSACMSSMITGPAKFPVVKAERANNREHRVTGEMLEFIEKARKAIDKKNNPEKYASDAIRSDDCDAIIKLKAKLVKLQEGQEKMKACNKIIRDKKENKIERLSEILGSKELAEKVIEPNCFSVKGFDTFELTNNNASIKSTAKRIAELEKASTRQTSELEIAGVRVVQNAEESRIQFFFEGKPEREVINLMKGKGFKWSPRNGCWQRLWNNNCVYVVKNFISPRLKELLNNSQ